MVAMVHDVLITAGVYALDGPRGHAGDRDRDPDDPRVLAVRHRRDLRQDQGEHRVDRARSGRDTYDGVVELLDEPGADALGQHVARRDAADPVAAAVRRRHAEGLRVRDVHRRRDRRLLVDLHRHPDPRDPEGARAAVPQLEARREVAARASERPARADRRSAGRRGGAAADGRGEPPPAAAPGERAQAASARPRPKSKRRRPPSASGGDRVDLEQIEGARPRRARLPASRGSSSRTSRRCWPTRSRSPRSST